MACSNASSGCAAAVVMAELVAGRGAEATELCAQTWARKCEAEVEGGRQMGIRESGISGQVWRPAPGADATWMAVHVSNVGQLAGSVCLGDGQ